MVFEIILKYWNYYYITVLIWDHFLGYNYKHYKMYIFCFNGSGSNMISRRFYVSFDFKEH